MSKLEGLKKYAEEPAITIAKIKNILTKVQIETVEKTTRVFNGLYYSRINIKNTHIGTTGKGLNKDYSLASAYGEFMERLQNDFLLILPSEFKRKELEKIFSFSLSPDEKIIKIETIINSNFILLKYMFKEHNPQKIIKYFKDNEFDNDLCLPFWNVKRKCKVYIPTTLLNMSCSSNGLCAGNNREEALIHGICEIFERYAQKRIYFDNITPPTIPLDYFKGTIILDIIKTIEKEKNLSAIIKDCSLGINLPVVGLILIDKINHTYTFHLGSDPSPIISLERCLTEIYQGGETYKFNSIKFSENPFDEKSEFFSIKNEKFRNYSLIVESVSGKWPNSIFDLKPDYEFCGFDYEKAISDKTDLKYLINLVFKLGYDINIRDVSFLGFPSYQVYIPGMSENLLYENRLNYAGKINKIKSIMRNLYNSSVEDLSLLGDYLEWILNYLDCTRSTSCMNHLIGIPHKSKQLAKLSPILFLFMLNYKINNLQKCFDYINLFIEKSELKKPAEYLFFSCMRDYIKLKIKNNNSSEIIQNLKMLYSESVVNTIKKVLSYPDKVFDHICLPNNFHCTTCKMKNDCMANDFFEYKMRLYESKKVNRINQKKLSDVF